MNKVVPIIGFAILTILALSVYGFAVYDAWIMQPVIGILLTLGLVGFLFTIVKEGQGLSKITAEGLLNQKNLLNFAAVFVGAVLAYVLNVNLKLGAVLGAAIVGLAAVLLFPDYAVPAYTGSFVGMASTTLLPDYRCLAFAGVVAGIVYVLTLTVFGGFGGKLGTIAASGCAFTGVCMGTEFTHPGVPKWDVGVPLIVYSIIAVALTYYLNNSRKQGPVLASSAVSVVAGLLLPALYGDIGKTLAIMAMCASFAGMSNTKRFPNIAPMLFVGLSAALVYMFSSPFIGGTGGKLGTIAFGSALAIRGLMDLVEKIQSPKKT